MGMCCPKKDAAADDDSHALYEPLVDQPIDSNARYAVLRRHSMTASTGSMNGDGKPSSRKSTSSKQSRTGAFGGDGGFGRLVLVVPR